MQTFNLDTFLSGHVFAFMLILCRIGGVLIFFPGISENYVAVRFRMLLAMFISFLLMGPLLPRLPAQPADIAGIMRLIGGEMMIGLFFGTILRFILGTLENAGFVLALQTGLSNATVMDPALFTQSPLASAFLSITGLTLIFVTGFDHMLFRSLAALYDLFPAGGDIMVGDMTQYIINTINQSFVIGIQLATPFMVMGILLFIAIGMMQRLMPQVQLFLVVLPVQIWGGLTLMGITIATIMTLWLHYCDTTIASFFAR